jgi:hypothetical protein
VKQIIRFLKSSYMFATMLLLCIAFVLPAFAADSQVGEMQVPREILEKSFGKRPYSPYADRGFPSQVYWGDTHLHTALSMDAGAFGNRLGLEEAYRFTRGEQVDSASGQPVKLLRPLDFIVVADHSDGMGFFPMLLASDPRIMEKEEGHRWYQMLQDGQGVDAALEIISLFSQGKFPWKTNDPGMMKPVWQNVIDAAEKYNEPGVFTALIGYEWTSLIRGNNMHRVVIYREDGAKASQMLPFTLADSADPEKLWEQLAAYEQKTGGQVLAIPHNGNLSNGMMFAETTVSGKKISEDYARKRIRWEPVYEVTQIKGDGEAHPFLSPDDEFADYETWDYGNLDLSVAKTNDMLKYEYGRSALKLGLAFEQKLGVNPYQFGLIGSTDSHTSLAAVEEENFFGKHSGAEPAANRASHVFMDTPEGKIMGWQQVSSGYAAVWAVENTRAAIFDALQRREVYGTTGSRIMVRFWGGWDFVPTDAQTRLPGDIGYKKGVPMGGELYKAPSGKSPSFLLAALKDPYNGNLDRIQIIKGWVDKKGREHERIYDVAVSDGRTIDKNGRCKTPVGNTVDVPNATWTNTIGDSELFTVWTDPDFDSGVPAFYYARVIEIPTPRWTAYDAKRYGVKMSDDVEMITQERAYTSPIWYTP